MIISLPDKYTGENSGKKILSIRLNPDGLSFSIDDPSLQDDYFFQEVSFDKSVSYPDSLKDCFFENPFFTWSFSQVNILTVTPVYTLVPTHLFTEKNSRRFLSFNFSYPPGEAVYNVLDQEEAVLVFNMDEAVFEFCSRSFIHPVYCHHLTPLLKLWKKQNLSHLQRQMYVNLHPSFIDIACFKNGKLEMINSYAWQQVSDILYYILYVWEQAGLDQLKDVLKLTGENSIQQQITPLLQAYLNNVQPMEIPSEGYLKGGNILKASSDLIALSL